MRIARWQRLVTSTTPQHDRGIARDHPDAGERHPAREPRDGAQAALTPRRYGEEQLVVVSPGNRLQQRIASVRFEIGARLGVHRERVRVDCYARAAGPGESA